MKFDEDLANIHGMELVDLTELKAGDFDGMTGLEKIALTVNYMGAGGEISWLAEDLFRETPNLKSFYVWGAAMSTLPENIFQGLSKLKNVEIGDNYIFALPSYLFRGLTSIETINISSNYITQLPEKLFDGLDHLKILNIEYNDRLSPVELERIKQQLPNTEVICDTCN